MQELRIGHATTKPDKRRESDRTRGDGTARGAGRGRDGMRRGNAITSRTRDLRAEEGEATVRRNEKAAAQNALPSDGMWRHEEN